jgi:glutamate receptor ionotropic, NMDA 1
MLLNVFIYVFLFPLFSLFLSTENLFVLLKSSSKEDATVIFRDAALYNMTDAGHVWIVTEQALFSNNTPIGTLGLKLNNDNETEHIRVSRRYL